MNPHSYLSTHLSKTIHRTGVNITFLLQNYVNCSWRTDCVHVMNVGNSYEDKMHWPLWTPIGQEGLPIWAYSLLPPVWIDSWILWFCYPHPWSWSDYQLFGSKCHILIIFSIIPWCPYIFVGVHVDPWTVGWLKHVCQHDSKNINIQDKIIGHSVALIRLTTNCLLDWHYWLLW